jgi:hypothetical protein
MLFSWSADSSHFLFGVIDENRSMKLYYVDATERALKEHELNIDDVERQVAAQLPARKEGNLAPHHQINFDQITWNSGSRCRLTYGYSLDRKSGEAALSLDLAEANPQLKIVKITSRAEP